MEQTTIISTKKVHLRCSKFTLSIARVYTGNKIKIMANKAKLVIVNRYVKPA